MAGQLPAGRNLCRKLVSPLSATQVLVFAEGQDCYRKALRRRQSQYTQEAIAEADKSPVHNDTITHPKLSGRSDGHAVFDIIISPQEQDFTWSIAGFIISYGASSCSKCLRQCLLPTTAAVLWCRSIQTHAGETLLGLPQRAVSGLVDRVCDVTACRTYLLNKVLWRPGLIDLTFVAIRV